MKKHKNNEVKVRVLTLGISKKTRKRLCKSDRKMLKKFAEKLAKDSYGGNKYLQNDNGVTPLWHIM